METETLGRRSVKIGPGFAIERTLCGVDVAFRRVKTTSTPFRVHCRCRPRVLWCSTEICHSCACSTCAALLEEFRKNTRSAREKASR